MGYYTHILTMNVLIFDIETIPDVSAGRKLYDLPDGLSDAEVAEALFALRRQAGQGDMLRLHMQRVVTISLVLRQHNKFRVWSLGGKDISEKEIIQRFFDGVEKYKPTLVSWNGSGFDLPVLHYRALMHGVCAPTYWETGEQNSTFRYNNYLNRYHYRHLDLMDVLSGYQSRATASLENIAILLGLPGKMGMRGDAVWNYFQQNRLQEIIDYCETDVLNTYLVYLRFEQMRGRLLEPHYTTECQQVREWLLEQKASHWKNFHEAWKFSVE